MRPILAFQTYFEYNKTGLDNLLVYATQTVPSFIPWTLFSLFLLVALVSFFTELRLSGKGDLAGSFAVAGYLTLIASFMMNLIPGLMSVQIMVICLIVAIIGTVWLFLSRRD